MITIKSFASSIPLCQLSFESLYVRLCSSTTATLRRTGDKSFLLCRF